ncbi:hypothetical protein [Tenacibaculum finnmarkense]|uniref:hypothetical protein n=1 Tax=Tenacibaculum finnmarkense TaxID=2781243 RepID=UPI003BB69B33
MKNKRNKLFKIGILFFGVSLLLWNCENDDSITEQNIIQNQVSYGFENKFNSDDFRETLKYQYSVDWSNPKKEYSEQLNSNFYEFPIIYSNAFNPDVFNKQVKRSFNEKYKVVVIENNDKEFEFFIAKYSLRNKESIPYKSLSILKNFGYDGTLNLYNKNAEMTFAKHISKEKELEDFYLKDKNLQQRGWETVCSTKTIYHYKDWYWVVYDGYGNIISSTYQNTTFEGTSQEKKCNQKWIPDPVRPSTPKCKYEIVDGLCPQKFDDIKPVIMCQQGFQDNGFGECEQIERLKDDFDQIDASKLTGKAECVYNKMVDNNNNINWILNNFKDGIRPSEFDLKFVMATDLPNSVNGRTLPANNNTIVIKINSNTLSDRTSLEVARTILHEGIHARLEEFAKRDGSNATDFPGIYDYYWRNNKNTWSHQQMAAHYIGTIAKGLKQYDNAEHSNQYYNDLAWNGLYKISNGANNPPIFTDAWNTLTPSEKTRIKNTISSEHTNGSKICN